MLVALPALAVVFSPLSSFPSGLRLIDGPMPTANCTGFNISHCVEAALPSADTDSVLIRTATIPSPTRSCALNSTIILPPQLAPFGTMANSVWYMLHGPTTPSHCWTIGTFTPDSPADPLLAYVDAETMQILLSEHVLSLVPESATPTVVRYYERLHSMIPADGALWSGSRAALARAFWDAVRLVLAHVSFDHFNSTFSSSATGT